MNKKVALVYLPEGHDRDTGVSKPPSLRCKKPGIPGDISLGKFLSDGDSADLVWLSHGFQYEQYDGEYSDTYDKENMGGFWEIDGQGYCLRVKNHKLVSETYKTYQHCLNNMFHYPGVLNSAFSERELNRPFIAVDRAFDYFWFTGFYNGECKVIKRQSSALKGPLESTIDSMREEIRDYRSNCNEDGAAGVDIYISETVSEGPLQTELTEIFNSEIVGNQASDNSPFQPENPNSNGKQGLWEVAYSKINSDRSNELVTPSIREEKNRSKRRLFLSTTNAILILFLSLFLAGNMYLKEMTKNREEKTEKIQSEIVSIQNQVRRQFKNTRKINSITNPPMANLWNFFGELARFGFVQKRLNVNGEGIIRGRGSMVNLDQKYNPPSFFPDAVINKMRKRNFEFRSVNKESLTIEYTGQWGT